MTDALIDIIKKLENIDRRLKITELKEVTSPTAISDCCCEPLTNGDADNPELIFADGDVVMVCGDIDTDADIDVLLLETGAIDALTQEDDDWLLLE